MVKRLVVLNEIFFKMWVEFVKINRCIRLYIIFCMFVYVYVIIGRLYKKFLIEIVFGKGVGRGVGG